MQLTTHTDYALRALIALGLARPSKMTAAEISAAYQVSENHMVKVLRNLAGAGYVETIRGKDGGVRLVTEPDQINIAQVVREMENDLGVVACLRKGGGSCTITPSCKLKGALERATESFLVTLSEYTLADILETEEPLRRLLGVRVPQLREATPAE